MVYPHKAPVMQKMFPCHGIIHLPLDEMAAKLQTIILSTTGGHELMDTLSYMYTFVDND